MNNLAQLALAAARDNPGARFGVVQENDRLDRVIERAMAVGEQLRAAGLGRGAVAAVLGPNSASYLAIWLAAQLAGVQTALINPAYPDELLSEMLDDLRPQGVLWVGRAPGGVAQRPILQIDAAKAWDGSIEVLEAGPALPPAVAAGEDCAPGDIATYMHTSGTTGRPKFCAQSHEYFIRLGRFFGDAACFSGDDVVVAPLPLFHINPLGYGVVGALTAGASALSMDRFDVKAFWPGIIESQATAVVLHLPPAEMLRSRTTADEASGHRLRTAFACPPPFLEQFGIPIGLSGYGSTEAGGLCHMWSYRKHDRDFPHEGPTHLGGRARYDVDWTLSEQDEILVRGKAPNVLFSGYARDGKIDDGLDERGWFHTGDRGRMDAYGNLVFIERASESIRVNAEYVPIDFVEDRLKRVASLRDFALWRVNSDTRGHEAVIYTTSGQVDVQDLRAAVGDLPRYMHPTRLIRIEAIPRDAGVGKVQRRLLDAQPVLEVTAL